MNIGPDPNYERVIDQLTAKKKGAKLPFLITEAATYFTLTSSIRNEVATELPSTPSKYTCTV